MLYFSVFEFLIINKINKQRLPQLAQATFFPQFAILPSSNNLRFKADWLKLPLSYLEFQNCNANQSPRVTCVAQLVRA